MTPAKLLTRLVAFLKRVLHGLAVTLLLVLGVASLGFGAALWLDNEAPGVSKVNKTTTTSVKKPLQEAGGTTTTTVISDDTNTPGTTSLRSETVVATALALGALFMFCGVFYFRVAKLTFPGGAGLELIAPETQAKVVESAAKQATKEGTGDDPAAISLLYEAALYELLLSQAVRSYPSSRLRRSPGTGAVDYPTPAAWGPGTSPGDDAIDDAVARAAGRLRPH